jgi:hypothetical protein
MCHNKPASNLNFITFIKVYYSKRAFKEPFPPLFDFQTYNHYAYGLWLQHKQLPL